MIYDVEQRTPEWADLRVGRVTASRIADVMTVLAKKKNGETPEAAPRRNYRAEIISESLTGESAEDTYTTPEMRWGIANEPYAIELYGTYTQTLVEPGGFHTHEDIDRFGVSPDGLVGDDGMLQVKCLKTANHLDLILTGEVPREYFVQIQAELACTGRKWCDFVGYDPRLPVHLRLFICRIERNEEEIANIEAHVRQFLAEVDATLAKLQPINEVPF
jgi:putative phage-type endonuclease